MNLPFSWPSVPGNRWSLYDPSDHSLYVFPINPNAMTGIGQQRTLSHSRWRYGVTTVESSKRERELGFSGVARSQAQYDALVLWTRKTHAIYVRDHVGRAFRIYLTDFIPTDRSPIPRAPARWRYEIKSKLLQEFE